MIPRCLPVFGRGWTVTGFAFCDFQTKSMADDCVRGMDGLKLENLAITVEIARR